MIQFCIRLRLISQKSREMMGRGGNWVCLKISAEISSNAPWK